MKIGEVVLTRSIEVRSDATPRPDVRATIKARPGYALCLLNLGAVTPETNVGEHAKQVLKDLGWSPSVTTPVPAREGERELAAALSRMLDMHEKMFKQTNVGASFYSGDTIAEMNEAPGQARRALAEHWKRLGGDV